MVPPAPPAVPCPRTSRLTEPRPFICGKRRDRRSPAALAQALEPRVAGDADDGQLVRNTADLRRQALADDRLAREEPSRERLVHDRHGGCRRGRRRGRRPARRRSGCRSVVEVVRPGADGERGIAFRQRLTGRHERLAPQQPLSGVCVASDAASHAREPRDVTDEIAGDELLELELGQDDRRRRRSRRRRAAGCRACAGRGRRRRAARAPARPGALTSTGSHARSPAGRAGAGRRARRPDRSPSRAAPARSRRRAPSRGRRPP